MSDSKKEELKQILKRIFKNVKNKERLSFEMFSETDGNIKAFQACREFNPYKNNLYIWGSTGTGKTHLAYATIGKWVSLGKRGDIFTVRELVNMFRMSKPEEEKYKISELVNLDILVIDDLGRIANSEFALDILADIIDKRTLLKKNGLLITSNLFLSDLSMKSNDDRLTSRIGGLCRVVEVKGDDWRQK